MNVTLLRYFDYLFDIRTLDWIVLGAWTVIFFLIGALLMWLWLHYRWYKGIAYQKRSSGL